MKIVKIEKSFESCQQAGWHGVDVYFDESVEEEQVLGWSKLGRMVYMKQLKQPFYKISNKSYLIRGITGNNYLRIGSTASYEQMLEKTYIQTLLELA